MKASLTHRQKAKRFAKRYRNHQLRQQAAAMINELLMELDND